MNKPTIGAMAPSFSLPDQDNKTHTLSNYLGEWVLIYFYPKDSTPGCTTQACGIRDSWSQLEKLNLVVFGVSKDSVVSHKKFSNKHDLPFTLLADEEKVVLEKYGVWVEKSMFGKKYMGIERSSFLIDPQGKIAKVYEKVSPKKHVGMVVKDMNSLL